MNNGELYKFTTPARPNWVKGKFDRQITHGFGQPLHGPAEKNIADKPGIFRKMPEANAKEKVALTETERQRAEAIYAWDVQLGQIIDRLKSTGEYRDTILMFTSDNGYYLGEHRRRLGKVLAHEPVIHVPLLVSGPGIQRGVRYAPISTFDITATILDVAGAKRLPRMDGTSKLDLMTGPDQNWTAPVITEGLATALKPRISSGVPRGFTTSGIRTGRYKLIKYSSGEGELYDLYLDPLELTNKFKDPNYRAIRIQLVQQWKKYRSCKQAKCHVPLPLSLQTDPGGLASQHKRALLKADAYYN